MRFCFQWNLRFYHMPARTTCCWWIVSWWRLCVCVSVCVQWDFPTHLCGQTRAPVCWSFFLRNFRFLLLFSALLRLSVWKSVSLWCVWKVLCSPAALKFLLRSSSCLCRSSYATKGESVYRWRVRVGEPMFCAQTGCEVHFWLLVNNFNKSNLI